MQANMRTVLWLHGPFKMELLMGKLNPLIYVLFRAMTRDSSLMPGGELQQYSEYNSVMLYSNVCSLCCRAAEHAAI